jgi:hypothetical protein
MAERDENVQWYENLVSGDYDTDALLSAEEDASLETRRMSADYYRHVRRAYAFLTAQTER